MVESLGSSAYLSFTPSSGIAFDFIPNRASQATLLLKNIVNVPVAFKIMTTAPRSYLVKPNLGVVMPNENASISLTLQPTPDLRDLKHKFLVKAFKTTLSSTASPEMVKQAMDTVPKDAIQQSKLDVVSLALVQGNDEPATEEPKRAPSPPRVLDMRIRRSGLDSFVKKKIEEKHEILRNLQRLQEDETRRLKTSQDLAKSRGQGVAFFHILLALLAGVFVGSLFLRPA